MQAAQDTYQIQIEQFEGPFDLLLFFIERDELDINDIPISDITENFLEYIRNMERMNIDLASEFILVAATLCRIKAKMLIPRKAVDEEGNEIDPREELVQRLLEYKRYKSVLEELRTMEERRSKQNDRGNVVREVKDIAVKALVDVELESMTLFKLMRTFERVMNRFEDRSRVPTVHTIYRYDYTIRGQQNYIFKLLTRHEKIRFEKVFEGLENRVHAIVTYLGMLELANLQRLEITLGEGINNFWLSMPSGKSAEEEVIKTAEKPLEELNEADENSSSNAAPIADD